ncbi:MAG: aminoglycoside phosphotransferase family protein [Akkermansiaceae bacterium]|nr:aminoglycoside phosphotransferase family protein [Armatimonadota bacterium]
MPTGKMHADEIDTDVALVRRLLTTQFLRWADLPIIPVPSGGTDNAIYRLGTDMAVRLPRIHWATGQVEKERRWLPHMAPRLPLAVPIPLATGLPGEGYPWHWSVYQWIEGENATADRLVDLSHAAKELAQFVTAFHAIDSTGGPLAGAHNFSRGVPLAMRDGAVRTAIAELDGLIDTDMATAAWKVALQAPLWNAPPVWVHGDLQSGNLLAMEGNLTAVIDFGAMGVGDPACDLIVAWNLFSAESREVFRTTLCADDATWARGRGWALSVGLIALPYYLNTSPAMVRYARHTISEVLADYEQGAGFRSRLRNRCSVISD